MEQKGRFAKMMDTLKRPDVLEKLSYTTSSLLPAKDLRKTSQKSLLEIVKEESVVGVIFNDEVKLSILESEVLESLIERLNELEEELEERNLVQELGDRVHENQWNRRPDGMSLSDFYQSRNKSR